MGHGVEVLNLLAEKHNDWINVVKSFGASKEVAEDVTQDMYIKLHSWSQKNDRSLMYNQDEVNYYFVFKVLRSIYLDDVKKNLQTINPDTEDIFLNRTNKEEIDSKEISEEVEDRLSKMYWYDRKIFELVYVKKISRLQLAEMTGISYHSIKRTVRKVKNLIKTIK
jgi:RNA polymerase sigma factor (sigma-70 family)